MSIVDEVKQRLDIVEFISGYLPLQKAGRNYKGLCPFHGEKTPSFVVFPDSQSWHCFGACSVGGDIFNFVMRRENMDFSEALRLLAEKAGLEIKPLDAEELRQRDEWDRLRALNAEAAQYYHHVLLESPRADAARRYLEHRGVKRETWGTFQLGYAPQEWHLVEEHLRRLSYTAEDILEAGLTTEGERGNVYDRFRDRIMFPIRDIQGHVIGFGGRALGEDSQPKYLNTPQTPLFDKGSVLYGINLTRNSIRESGTAVIVEGYMDVVVPYQCGATNLVACMGTALTEEQLDTLKHIARRLVLALDPDAAGLRAVERGVQTAQQTLERKVVPVPTAKGLIRYEEQLKTEIRILTLPDGMDPDELVLSDRQRWDRLVEEALPVAEHFFQLAINEGDLATAKGKRQVVDRLLPVLATIDNPVERTHYLQRLAQRVRVDERQLAPELERLRAGPGRPRAESQGPGGRAQPAQEQPPREAVAPLDIEERCLAISLKEPHLLPEAVEATGLSAKVFQDERNRQVFETLQQAISQGSADRDHVRALLAERLDTALLAHVESIAQRLESDPSLSLELVREDLLKSSARLCKSHLTRLIREVRFLQQDAQEQDAPDQVGQLNRVIDELMHDYLRIEQRYHATTMAGRRGSREKLTSGGGD
jgi:DNA primase